MDIEELHGQYGGEGTSATVPPSKSLIVDPANGKILWHAGLGAQVSNAPETFMIDGRQYVLIAAGDILYAFALNL